MNWLFETVLKPVKQWFEKLPWWKQIAIALFIICSWYFREQLLQIITPTTAKPRIINFRTFTRDRTLSGKEYAREGIKQITPVVEDPSYCAGAKVVLLQPREHDPPGSFLSTALQGQWTICNTLPISFEFNEPVRTVTVEFRGGAVPYELIAYDNNSLLVGQNSQNAQAYSTESYTVTFTSSHRNINAVTFGYTYATTQILHISFQQ